jgi:hypothetical protein
MITRQCSARDAVKSAAPSKSSARLPEQRYENGC